MPGEMEPHGPPAPGQGLPEATREMLVGPGLTSRALATGRSGPWRLPGTCSLGLFPRLCAAVPSGRDHLHPPRSTYTSRPLRLLQPPSITRPPPSTAEPDPH